MHTKRPTAALHLRAVRESHGLGLREAARRAGIDHAQLSRVERGEESLSIAALERLARVLDLTTLADQLASTRPSKQKAAVKEVNPTTAA